MKEVFELIKEKKNEKVLGYILRLGAVIVWGIDPLIVKYSPLSEIPINVQIPLLILGAVLFTGLSILFLGKTTIQKNYKLEINKYFVSIIFSTIGLIVLLVFSLKHTSSTSFILINNFAPILALLVGLVFWKSSLPYLKSKNSTFAIFIVFFLGIVGTSLVIYEDFLIGSSSTLLGNFLAFLYMLLDVVFVVSQIQYIKNTKGSQSYFVNFYLYFFSFLALLPLLFYNFNSLFSVTLSQLLWALFLGVLWGLGTLLTFEAYKRIDGFIGFLMFNISILITIVVESLVLGEIEITAFLIVGTVLIIGASVFAEVINTKMEDNNRNKK